MFFLPYNRKTLYVRTRGATDFDAAFTLAFDGPVHPRDAVDDWRPRDALRRGLSIAARPSRLEDRSAGAAHFLASQRAREARRMRRDELLAELAAIAAAIESAPAALGALVVETRAASARTCSARAATSARR